MYVSIDLGGSFTRVASSKDLNTFYKAEKFQTLPSLQEQKDKMIETVERIVDGNQLECMSLGIPGMLDRGNYKFYKVPNYSVLNGVSYEFFFGDKFPNVSVLVENDAALAGLCEATIGAGKHFHVVGYITLSTGVGGIRIDEKMLPDYQLVSEPGHHVIDMHSEHIDGAGVRGSFEALCSGTAFKKIYGIKSEDCTDHKKWEDYGKILGIGLLNISTLWSPDIIVLGGSVSNRFDSFYPTVKKTLDEIAPFKVPHIVKSEKMDDAGLYGGFIFIKNSRN